MISFIPVGSEFYWVSRTTTLKLPPGSVSVVPFPNRCSTSATIKSTNHFLWFNQIQLPVTLKSTNLIEIDRHLSHAPYSISKWMVIRPLNQCQNNWTFQHTIFFFFFFLIVSSCDIGSFGTLWPIKDLYPIALGRNNQITTTNYGNRFRQRV